MGYEHTNSKGQVYYLQTVKSTRGCDLYYFSKQNKLKSERAIELPENFEVVENTRSGLPVIRKKK